MNADLISLVMRLRVAVGYLGEKDQNGWWTSSFLSPTSKPFLSPVFPRTFALAQLHGVTAAAAAVHDDRIGVGDVFHLFRLSPLGHRYSLRTSPVATNARRASTAASGRPSNEQTACR